MHINGRKSGLDETKEFWVKNKEGFGPGDSSYDHGYHSKYLILGEDGENAIAIKSEVIDGLCDVMIKETASLVRDI